MKNAADYSLYECPYSHLEKETGHKLEGPEGFADTYGVWCACGFRGPVFYLDPAELGLKKKAGPDCSAPATKAATRDPKPHMNCVHGIALSVVCSLCGDVRWPATPQSTWPDTATQAAQPCVCEHHSKPERICDKFTQVPPSRRFCATSIGDELCGHLPACHNKEP